MLKKAVLVLLAVLCVATAWFLWMDRQFWDSAPSSDSAPEGAASQSISGIVGGTGNGTKDGKTPGTSPTPVNALGNATDAASAMLEDDSSLSLRLKTILLSQGEGGIEIWRLKARWANIQKEGDSILAAEPRLVYKMPPDNRELLISADAGDIRQKEQILRFIGNVLAVQGNSTVRGPLLVYNGSARTMAFAEGGVFDGEGVSGSAPQVVWHMQNNTIEASGGIAVEFTQSPSLSELQSAKDSQ